MLKDTWKPRIDGVDIADSSAVNEIADAVIDLESSGVESYVQEEAERVAKNVYAKQNGSTFTFLAISDMHNLTSHAQIMKSNIHAGQGMDLIRKSANIDFAICLGDNGWGSGLANDPNRATIDKGIEEIRAANKYIDAAFRGVPNFRTPGNHDSLIYNYTFNGNAYLDNSKLFPLYGAYNRGTVYPAEKDRGYCYRDFDEFKLRVILMNTSDIQDLTPADNTPDIYVSGTQGKWFAETLDMSSKADAAEWSILILSHAPIDWGVQCIWLCDILKAYAEGGAVSVVRDGVTISYNYTGKNAATIIGNCHGHNHNFQTDYLRRLKEGTNATEPITYKRFCIPNACFTRTNEKGENTTTEILDIEYGEATSYEKVANTAQDTAFCVVTVDTAARKIYADHYGAGYDRDISYVYVAPIVNQIPISTDASGAIYNGKGYKENTKLSTSGGGEVAASGVVTVGFIPIDGTNHGGSATATGYQVLRLKNIQALPTDANVRITFYDTNKAMLGFLIGNNNFSTTPTAGKCTYTLGADGYIDTIDVSGYVYSLTTGDRTPASFIRFCSPGINGESIITLNQPIE